MNLTADNTAVVLDSTADFPDAQARFPNFRIVPLYVRFGDESFKDYVDITPERFYERLQTDPELPTTSQPTPGDFLATFEELAPVRADPVDPDLVDAVRHLCQRPGGGGDARRRSRARDRLTNRFRVARDARDRGPAPARAGHDRRGDRPRTSRTTSSDHHLLFTVNTLEYLARGGRIGRAAAFAGNLLNVKPILTIRDGEVIPLKRVRGNAKAFAEFRSLFESTSSDSPNLKVGIAHAAAPERLAALRELVEHVRPHAEIEMATPLGPVVGTHAGPGTVGFFWYEDA